MNRNFVKLIGTRLRRIHLSLSATRGIGLAAASLVISSLVVPMSSSPADASTLTPVVFQLSGVANGSFAPFTWAVQSGIYRKFGFNVTLNFSANTTVPITALADGTAQFGLVAGLGILEAQSQGENMEMVQGITQVDPTGLVVMANSGITTPAGLEGKTIACINDPVFLAETNAWLTKNNVPLSSVTIQPLATATVNSTFIAGQAQAAVAYPYATAPVYQAEGYNVRPFIYNGGGLGVGLTVMRSFAQAHSHEVTQFINATQAALQGATATAANEALAADSLVAAYPATSPAYSAVLGAMVGRIPYFTTPNDKGHPFGYMALADWKSTQALGLSAKVLTSSIPLSTAYTNQYQIEPNASVSFAGTSSVLTKNAKDTLSALAKEMLVGASVTVTGYASKNSTLAAKRAHVVATYLLNQVKVHVKIVTVSKTVKGHVSAVLTGQ